MIAHVWWKWPCVCLQTVLAPKHLLGSKASSLAVARLRHACSWDTYKPDKGACCLMHCLHPSSSVVVLALSNQVLHTPSQAGGILWPPFLDTGGDTIWNELTGSLSERFCIASDILRDLP